MPTFLDTGPTVDLVIGMVETLPNEALNWAVAYTLPTRADPKVTLGADLHWTPSICTVWGGNRFAPTTDWAALGLAIERSEVVISNHYSPEHEATTDADIQEQRMDLTNYWGGAHSFFSGTRVDTWRGVKIATCRSIVLGWLVLGNKIPMPLSLLDPSNEQA